jgi:hypothetical protein
MKLEQVDFTWKICHGVSIFNDDQWNRNYDTLLAFRREHGHCDVPHFYKEDESFGNWVARQRQYQVYGTLRKDRKQRLDEIGFTWSFEEQFFEQWTEHYEQLKCLQEINGHLRILSDNANAYLTRWVHFQRILFANGRLEITRKALLDEIGFSWDIQAVGARRIDQTFPERND